MSVSLSRRDAIKGMMAAGAAVVASPYLASLSGTAQASPNQSVPVQGTKASSSSSSNLANSISSDVEPIVLIIKNDVVRGFKGLQEVRVQDSGLASNLKSTMAGRFG